MNLLTLTPNEAQRIAYAQGDDAPEGLARDYALAFLSDVNWHEIAQHLIDQNETEGATT